MRPAILLITTDEQRKDTLGCYGCGAIATPHIDALAARGQRYERAYAVSPQCLPSRCSILTGCYPHTHGAYSNFRDFRLSPECPNLYNLLSAAGYSTAHFGKCHYERVRYGTFSPDTTAESNGTRPYYASLGIEHLALQDDKNVSVWQYDDYSRELELAGILADYRREAWNKAGGGVFPFPGPSQWHPDAWVGRKAAEYIESSNDERTPFVWLSFSGPHYPIDPPAEYLDRVDTAKLPQRVVRDGEWSDPRRIHHRSYHGKGGIDGCGYQPDHACGGYDDVYWDRMRHHYCANVALIDDEVGRVVGALERRYGDETLILFTADHGDMLGNHGLWGKNNCGYEEVLNVPLIVKQPRSVGAGRVVAERVQGIDILPTCLVAAEAPLPAMDGRPLEAVVSSGGYACTLAEGEGFFCVSDGRHKLIRAMLPGETNPRFELHDLERDPDCFDNFIDDPDYAKARAALGAALNEFFVGRLLA